MEAKQHWLVRFARSKFVGWGVLLGAGLSNILSLMMYNYLAALAWAIVAVYALCDLLEQNQI